MSKLRELLRRRRLWLLLLAALVPLSALLFLQYRWLDDLRESFASAQRSDRHDYIEKVALQVEYEYRTRAARALDLPSSIMADERIELAAKYFARRNPVEARRLFASRLLGADWVVLFYDPETRTMIRPEYGPEVRAAIQACLALKIRSERGDEVPRSELIVDEQDPANRIILRTVVDENSRIVGVTGMIVDTEYFRRAILPSEIEGSLTPLLAKHAIVTVKDGTGELAYSSSDPLSSWSEVESNFGFVFQDWRIGLHSSSATPEDLAGRNFAFNVGLLAVIWAVLLTGAFLAVRLGSREIRLSQMKSDFVSNVSHELRTPLASIRVFGELLRLGRVTEPERVREYGEYIETESRRLSQLLNNILDFSKIESGARVYNFEPEDLAEVVESCIDAFRVRLRHDGFHLVADLRGGDIPPILLDRQAVRQAINNVIDNAIKYSGDSKFIGIRLARQEGEAVVSISDKGVGIPPAEQLQIFERFHRVGTGLVHDVKGSGLGLAIVKHIVEAHGGRVDVDSEPGDGATFLLRFPLVGSRAGAVVPGGESGAWGGASAGRQEPS
jgi:two-component system phosphate regulon sensor histidine kinase PhoR